MKEVQEMHKHDQREEINVSSECVYHMLMP